MALLSTMHTSFCPIFTNQNSSTFTDSASKLKSRPTDVFVLKTRRTASLVASPSRSLSMPRGFKYCDIVFASSNSSMIDGKIGEPERSRTATMEATISPSTSTSTIIEVHSQEDLKNLMETNTDRLIILDCASKNCGPCKLIYPTYQKFSQQFQDAIFCKVDIEENEDTKALGTALGVEAMPTFFGFRNSKTVGICRGAKVAALKNILIDNTVQGEAGFVLPCFRQKTFAAKDTKRLVRTPSTLRPICTAPTTPSAAPAC